MAPPRRFFPDLWHESLTRDATLTWKTGSIEPGQVANIGGRYSACAKLAQAGGLRRFRQLVASLIEYKPVMMVARRVQTKQHLKQAVDGRCMKQIAAAHRVGHTLRGVVDDIDDTDNVAAVISNVHGVAEVVDELEVAGVTD